MSTSINKSIVINNTVVKNRILMPPMVCFNWADDNGYETVDRSVHYGQRAKGGTGLIVVEAAAIAKSGRLCDTELGIWEDGQVGQFAKIAEVCHGEDTKVIVQIVHAGMNSVGSKVFSCSPVPMDKKECLEMSLQQIEEVKAQFVSAAVRAEKAGLDGVEIHGAHGYLLNQFTSKRINNRTDIYGGSLENRFRLPLEIVEEIKEATGDNFIIGYRFGVNDPSMEEDKILAKKLEVAGVHLLNVSAGIGGNDIVVPEDYPYSFVTYMGTQLYKEVSVPVACVSGIKEPKQAEYLLDNKMIDMVAVGRGLLADPKWTNKAIANEDVNVCYSCKPRCKFIEDGKKCPWL